MKANNAISGVIFLLIAIIAFVHSGNFPAMPGVPYGPSLFPRLVACAMALASVLLIVSGLRQLPRRKWIELADWAYQPRSYILFFSVIGAVVAYLLLAERLGFLTLSIVILIFLFNVSRGLRRWKSNVVIALVFSVLIFSLFSLVLRVPLPYGPLESFAMGYS